MIARATPDDADAIATVWIESRKAGLPTVPPVHDEPAIRRWCATHLISHTAAYVGRDKGAIVAMMALSDTMIEQLYVAPTHWGRGIGSALVAHAKAERPAGLSLFTFAVNDRARQFYAAHGFAEIAHSDGADNEERAPDILMRWEGTA
ncbi:MAG: GNAT family N-acetyltransferase [Pseudomonadota bacterium]